MTKDTNREIDSLPKVFPEFWASDWGQDDKGLWMSFTFKGVRQTFRWIPPGRFMMGSPEDEPGRNSNEILHEVRLTKGYWLADTACTQELWEAVMGDNPAEFKGEKRPVENVSFDDVRKFIEKLNSFLPELKLRLPTEAEWEYACRAGTNTPFSFGENINTDQVNYEGNYPYNNGEKGENREGTVEVKSLPPNDWGLYEMDGNVKEWCSKGDGEYSKEAIEESSRTKAGDSHVLTGSLVGFSLWALYKRASPKINVGFRLARGQ